MLITFDILKRALGLVPETTPVSIELPSGSNVPAHFHITEIGKVHKMFVDCGGVLREDEYCELQVWVADDIDHRITAGKLFKIMDFSKIIIPNDLKVEVEYGIGGISRFNLDTVKFLDGKLTLILKNKQTACLAPDKCGVKCCPDNKC